MNEDQKTNEQQAALAFSRQSIHFDEIYKNNTIVHYKRERVRTHLYQFLPPHASILELNAGTGEDAIWLARQGHQVHATDIATGMQERLMQKVTALGLQDEITTELRSFTELGKLECKGPFDHIFSNFAGLNCTGQLGNVLASFPGLVKQGGMITLVILPNFCLWEFSLLLKGKFKTATRRFLARNGRKARLEDEYFKCWYYNPSFIVRELKDQFDLVAIEGLCTFVPPSYLEGFAEKYPKLYARLTKLEERWKSAWPFTSIGDYYIISLRKK